MTAKPTMRASASKFLEELFYQLVLPLTFALIVLFFFPSRANFQFSFDEGVNLMKSMLMGKGYHLYAEIWSDQPPLFSYILTKVIDLTGNSVAPGRLLVLVFSCLLLWAAIQFMRLSWGNSTALIGAILIFFLPRYLILSYSVMIGLPAISLAMLSLLFQAYWHYKRKWVWLVLSAILLALSVLTKLFTGILAPLFLAGLLMHEVHGSRDKTWFRVITPALVWGCIFGVLGASLGLWLVGFQNLPQLLEPHLAATSAVQFDQPEFTLSWYLRGVIPILILAAIGTVFAIQEKKWISLYLSGWSVFAYLSLFRHTPIWEHHLLLITIPAAMLAAIATFMLFHLIVNLVSTNLKLNFTNMLLAISLAAFIMYFFPFAIRDPLNLLSPIPSISAEDLGLGPTHDQTLRIAFKYAPRSKWMVTDLPMVAYRAGVLVPPNLAVFTAKRYASGFITQEDLIDAVKEYQPEQVLLGRYEYPLVDSFLVSNGYHLVHQADLDKLYIRKDLLR